MTTCEEILQVECLVAIGDNLGKGTAREENHILVMVINPIRESTRNIECSLVLPTLYPKKRGWKGLVSLVCTVTRNLFILSK